MADDDKLPRHIDLDDPGIEDTHTEHLPGGDFVPPVADVAPGDAEGDVSGELPPEHWDDGENAALGLTDVD